MPFPLSPLGSEIRRGGCWRRTKVLGLAAFGAVWRHRQVDEVVVHDFVYADVAPVAGVALPVVCEQHAGVERLGHCDRPLVGGGAVALVADHENRRRLGSADRSAGARLGLRPVGAHTRLGGGGPTELACRLGHPPDQPVHVICAHPAAVGAADAEERAKSAKQAEKAGSPSPTPLHAAGYSPQPKQQKTENRTAQFLGGLR